MHTFIVDQKLLQRLSPAARREVLGLLTDDLQDTKAQFRDYNWDPEGLGGGRNFGHLAYQVDDIYETCQRLADGGVTINRPPRDGYMAFVRSPDDVSIELLQKGGPLEPSEPWKSMSNTGEW